MEGLLVVGAFRYGLSLEFVWSTWLEGRSSVSMCFGMVHVQLSLHLRAWSLANMPAPDAAIHHPAVSVWLLCSCDLCYILTSQGQILSCAFACQISPISSHKGSEVTCTDWVLFCGLCLRGEIYFFGMRIISDLEIFKLTYLIPSSKIVISIIYPVQAALTLDLIIRVCPHIQWLCFMYSTECQVCLSCVEWIQFHCPLIIWAAQILSTCRTDQLWQVLY